jgi:hypothetical protein
MDIFNNPPMMTIKFGAVGAGATLRYGSGSVFLCSRSEGIRRFGLPEIGRSDNGRLRRMVVWRMVAYGDWSFGDWSFGDWFRRMVVRRMDGVPIIHPVASYMYCISVMVFFIPPQGEL